MNDKPKVDKLPPIRYEMVRIPIERAEVLGYRIFIAPADLAYPNYRDCAMSIYNPKGQVIYPRTEFSSRRVAKAHARLWLINRLC